MAKPKPVCLECCVELKVERNGVFVETVMSQGHAYELWCGDEWVCPDCGHKLMIGYAANPTAQHWETEYRERRELAERSSHVYQLVR